MVKVKVSVKLDGDPKHYVVDESGYITGDVEVETEDGKYKVFGRCSLSPL